MEKFPALNTCLVLQSSRVFSASFTMSIKTGRTTHSDFVALLVDATADDNCELLQLIDGSEKMLVSCIVDVWGGDELGVMNVIRFSRLPVDVVACWVCFFHKFKSCECSMCLKRQSSCCWFDNEMRRWSHCWSGGKRRKKVKTEQYIFHRESSMNSRRGKISINFGSCNIPIKTPRNATLYGAIEWM